MKRLFALLLTLFLPLLGAAQVDEGDLLMPSEAFKLKATAAGGEVRLDWAIAEGYYLYKDKFKVRQVAGVGRPGELRLPAGKVKDDEFFGPMEIYRDRVRLVLPVADIGGGDPLSLEVTSQGCADVGVCYPPQVQTVELTMAAAAPRPSPLADLAADLGGDGDDFLDPEVAFQPTLEPGAAGTLVARWQVAEGYYLYKDKFRFALVAPAGAQVGEPRFPPAKVKDDPLFGRTEVYYQQAEVVVPVSGAPGERVTLALGYQGCAEAGICYPPQTKELAAVVPPGEAAPAAPGEAVPAPEAREDEMVSEQDRLAALLGQDRWIAILAFFGFGLLLAFTPCVFPMIPILSGIIAGQGSNITTRKAFVLSLTYVLAMSVTYTVAGVIAGKFGHNLQAALQNPWMLSAFAVIFVLLALSMFGFYDLQLPSSWQSKLSEISNRQQGGNLAGVAVMGFLSALIVGPCVAPPLAGALIYIGQTGDPWLGGMALFALSMGMGAPLVAVGTLEGRYLPRAGGWMNAVKAVFGVLMLAVAVYLLERVLPGPVILALWASLLLVSAIYMGALEPLGKDASGWRKLWKGSGLVMLVYGALLLIGAAAGGSDPFQPLRGVAVAGSGGGAHAEELEFKPIKGIAGLEAELAAAGAAGKPVMLDFYADWCVACKELEKYTFTDAAVQAAVADAVLLQADVTANDAEDQALMKQAGIFGPPAILFFGPDGNERKGYRLVGFLGPEEFAPHARKALD